MHHLLEKLLEKRGIKSVDTLKEDKELNYYGLKDEKKVFNEWSRILSEGDMSVERIQEFCTHQIKQIESFWRDKDRKNKAGLIPYHTCYKLILDAIEAPKAKREELERHLNELLAE